MKLNVKAFSLTCAILWGLSILILTWWLLLYGSPGKIIIKLSGIYFGYTYSWFGGIIGFLWGFVDGLIGGAVFAWLYNKLLGSKNST